MRFKTKLILIILLIGLTSSQSMADVNPLPLTLAQAENIAITNYPQIKAAALQAQVGAAQVQETRAAEFPFITGSLTGVDAEQGSRISAGGLNNPLIFSRYANGVSLNQLITDFGRTSDLIRSSTIHEQALQKNVEFTRTEVLFQADKAYYDALRSQALLKVAQSTVAEREAVVEQVTALAKNKLKSGLDLSFAEVNLTQGKLLRVQARNEMEASYMTLATALGISQPQRFALVDETSLAKTPPDLNSQISLALSSRQDLRSLRLERDSADWYAKAQGALSLPTVDLAGALGESPVHAQGLTGSYAVVGVNVNIPIFNGNLFSEEAKEAHLKVGIEDQNVRNLENQITHDVGVAWLNIDSAYQNLELTADLRKQAAEALDLAQARYTLGLASIVELGQAQLNLTQAEIDEVAARYDYQIQSLNLDYQVGIKR